MVTQNVKEVFARQFQVDNRRLQKARTTLGELAANPEALANHRLEVVRLLGELRDQLAIHFALEEACGYFEEARDVAPHLVAQADALKAEHEALFERIRHIAEEAEQYASQPSTNHGKPHARRPDATTAEQQFARIVRRFQVFDRCLAEHEGRDNALMLDAFDTDIGGGG